MLNYWGGKYRLCNSTCTPTADYSSVMYVYAIVHYFVLRGFEVNILSGRITGRIVLEVKYALCQI